MSAKVWKKRIEAYNDGEPIKQSLITQIKSLFNRSFFTKSKEEVLLLEEVALYQYGRGPGWSITSEQALIGVRWLLRSNMQKYFDDTQKNILQKFDHFTYEGVRVGVSQSGLCQVAEPVYRVHAKDGSYFDYTASPWQQGTKTPFEIIRTVTVP